MPASLPPGRSNFCACPRRCRCGLSLRQDSAVLVCRVSLWDCRPGPVDMCICPGCTRPMATCVMTVSVSTLLTGRCGLNCLYLNCLDNEPLAKRSFRKVVLTDSCRGCCLAMPSISVSYRECVPNRACQEGRICTCPRRCSCGLSLWQDSAVLELRVSLRDCRPRRLFSPRFPTLLTGRYGSN